MKYISFLFYLLVSIILFSCNSDDIVNTNPSRTLFDVPIFQYNENSYLLDTSYGSVFEQFELNGSSSINIIRVEVWVYCDSTNPLKRQAVGLTNIPPRPTGGYGTTLGSDSDGYRRIGNFIKLYENEYSWQSQAGYITIRNFNPVSPRDAIFAAYYGYINGNYVQYGDFVDDIPAGSILTLKMLRDRSEKSPRENVAYTQLWNLMLKNIYSIGVTNIPYDHSKLTLNIYNVLPGTGDGFIKYFGSSTIPTWANGKNYIYLTGIDRKTNENPGDTVIAGDGLFDFFPGNTIDLESGSIIFPTLKPFSTTMIREGVMADSLYMNDSIYYNSKATLNNGLFLINFRIKGTVYN